MSFAADCDPGYGLNASNECEICAAGYFSDGGATPCTKCPAGTYSNSAGATSCTECPAGTWSGLIGATSDSYCKSCPSGHCCANGNKYTCVKGTYANGGGICGQASSYSVSVCTSTRGDPVCTLQDVYIYKKGVCTPCRAGCTTEGVGSISNSDCTVKTAAEFNAGTNRFVWPIDGSISEQSLNSAINNNIHCPGD